MKAFLWLGIALAVGFSSRCAALDVASDEIAAADDRRIAAMLSADRTALEAVLSAELRYGHSNGVVDTRDDLIEALAGKRIQYRAIEPGDRTIKRIARDVATVAGQGHLKVNANGQVLEMTVSYLAVYRREQEFWRLIAWQSARLPATPPPNKS